MDYSYWGTRELIERIETLESNATHTRETMERVANLLADDDTTTSASIEARIQLYEALGCTRGDAQGIVEAQDLSK